MSKFCGKCGNQLPDDAKICGYCGCVIEQPATPAQPVAPVQPVSPVQSDNNYQYEATQQTAAPAENVVSAFKNTANGFFGKMKTDKKFKFMVIGIGAGTLTIILALILILCLGKGYTKAIDNQIDALYGDYDAYIDCYPESHWDQDNYEMPDEDEYNELFDDIIDSFDSIDIDYEVVDEDLLEGSSLTTLKSTISNRWGVSKKDIDEAYSVSVLFSVDRDNEDYFYLKTFTVVKIDGSWYTYGLDLT